MPTFEFTSPEGKTYSVDGPDGATKEQAFQILQQHLGEKPAEGGSSLSGVAKSLGSGVAQGAIGLASLPGDILNLAGSNNHMHESLQKAVEGITGPLYQPQGTAENIASNVGQFLPAVVGGPETLAAKLATRVAAPAVTAEAGRQVAGPYGEAIGGLIGAGGATAAARKFQELAAARSAASTLPTGEDLVKTGSNQFEQARNMNLVVKPDFVDSAVADMKDAIKGFDPEGQKPVFSAVDRLEKLTASAPGLPPTAVEMNQVENVRKQLSNLRMSTDPPTRQAAKDALEALTARQAALSPADAVSGDANAYAQTMKNAVGNYGAGKRSQIIQGKTDLAELNAGTAGSGANIDNNTRQAIKQLARPINNTNVPVAKRLGFNEAEIEAIKKAATGTVVGNTARYLGKAAPTGIVSGAGDLAIGGMAGGPVGAIALPAAGYIAKKIGDLSTKKAVAAIDSLVRSRSPLAAQVAAQLPPQIVNQLPKKSQLILQKLVLVRPAIPQGNGQLSQPVSQPNTY